MVFAAATVPTAVTTAEGEAKTEQEGEVSFFTNDMDRNLSRMRGERGEVEDIILYSNNKRKLNGLGSETLGCLLLDCGCSHNVMGEGWWRSYLASLSEEMKQKVKVADSKGRRF